MLQFVASIVPHYIIGMALGAGFYGMFMLCQGFFITSNHIPGLVWCITVPCGCAELAFFSWWIWGYYMGFHTYEFEIFMNNEFGNNGAVGQFILGVC